MKYPESTTTKTVTGETAKRLIEAVESGRGQTNERAKKLNAEIREDMLRERGLIGHQKTVR